MLFCPPNNKDPRFDRESLLFGGWGEVVVQLGITHFILVDDLDIKVYEDLVFINFKPNILMVANMNIIIPAVKNEK